MQTVWNYAEDDVATEVPGIVRGRKARKMTVSMFRDRFLVRGFLPCPVHFEEVSGVALKNLVVRTKEWINDFFELWDIPLRCIRISVCEMFRKRKFHAPVGCWMLSVEDVDEGGPLTANHEAVIMARAKLQKVVRAVTTKDGVVVLCVTTSHEACV